MTDGWHGILEADEKILWQGAPSGRLRFEFSSPLQAFLAVFFVGFSLFWMAAASQSEGAFWMFGLLIFGTGLFNLVGIHFWKAFVRTNTHYTLTNKRAFVGDRLFGRKRLKSYPILPETTLKLEETDLDGSIFFAEEIRRNRNSNYAVPIGFECISDARVVLQKMNEIQQGKWEAQ